jgi:hypothetical protein
VDEGREQTAAIHRLQRERETLAGLLRGEARAQVLATHRAAQRLLRPLAVVNPFAEQLTFLDDRTRARRDHMKYLSLIRAITLLHQYQRPIRTVQHGGRSLAYVEATLDDIAAANRLAHDVLGRCLDEMPPQTRRLLALLEKMVGERCASIWTGLWSSNTSCRFVGTGGRASFMSSPTTEAARTGAGSCRGSSTWKN